MGSLAYAQKWERQRSKGATAKASADTTGDAERDAELVARTLAGDQDAFRRIVELQQKRVYAVALRMTRRPDVADDVAQESFLRAYRSLDKFELGRRLSPWLTKIAVNLSINRLNDRTARREESLDETVDPEEPRKRPEPRASSVESDPMRTLAQAELSRALAKALDALPEEQRAVFVLKVEEGMRYDEIAETLSISAGTVMSRLSRARAKLKERLAPHLAGMRGGAPGKDTT